MCSGSLCCVWLGDDYLNVERGLLVSEQLTGISFCFNEKLPYHLLIK